MITNAAILYEGILYIGKDYKEITSLSIPKKAYDFGERGFVSDKECFLSPEEAAIEAYENRQIAYPQNYLFPEDLTNIV